MSVKIDSDKQDTSLDSADNRKANLNSAGIKCIFQQKYKMRLGMAFRVFDLDTKKSIEQIVFEVDKPVNTFILIKEQEYHFSMYYQVCRWPVNSHTKIKNMHAYYDAQNWLKSLVLLTVTLPEKNNPIFSCLSSDSFSELEKSTLSMESFYDLHQLKLAEVDETAETSLTVSDMPSKTSFDVYDLHQLKLAEVDMKAMFVPATMSDEEVRQEVSRIENMTFTECMQTIILSIANKTLGGRC